MNGSRDVINDVKRNLFFKRTGTITVLDGQDKTPGLEVRSTV